MLAGPDRADEWGEELTEIGKWQRTMGPIYIQGVGGALVILGFFNYFALGNMGNASSTIWVTAILTVSDRPCTLRMPDQIARLKAVPSRLCSDSHCRGRPTRSGRSES